MTQKLSPASMTAFASLRGQGTDDFAQASWVWEIRSVNGKGLDLRLRLPDGIERLEAAVRAALTKRLVRGNVSVGLRLHRGTATDGFRVNPTALATTLTALAEVSRQAAAAGVPLGNPSTAEVLSLRGVTEAVGAEDSDPAPLLAALLKDFDQSLTAFETMRHAEGTALVTLITGQIDGIETLVEQARAAAEARRPKTEETLRQALRRVTEAVDADPARLAQELALLAVKADITEETDRLSAHITAARALLAQGGPVGRKFDFLAQEFNREANTLCSKSGDIALTRIGLDLKHLIDQMREQVQNLE